MTTVLDAGPIVAATNRRDRYHRLAVAAIRGSGVLLVPDAVVCEVDHILRQRVSSGAARAFLADVRAGAYRRVALSAALFERAVSYDRTYATLDLGLADASVMALAEAERADILTFDFRDFRATRPLGGGSWRLALGEEDVRRLVR